MKEGARDRFLNIVTIVLLALIIGGGALLAFPSWRRGESLKRQEREWQDRIRDKKAEVEKLRDYQKRFSRDGDFVESVARSNDRAYVDEIIFVFDD